MQGNEITIWPDYFLGAAMPRRPNILPPLTISSYGYGRRRMLRIKGEYSPDKDVRQYEKGSENAYRLSKQIIDQLQVLSEVADIPITQENGQQIFGPPRHWNGLPPDKGCEVFVGSLPRDMNQCHLFSVFSRMGPIYEMRIMMDFSGSNRGYCFVQFANVDDAQKAILELNEYEILPGRRIGVTKSVDNTRLCIRGIPNHKTEEEVMKEMGKYTDGVTKVIVIPRCHSSATNQGLAFVEYGCHKNATMARRSLIPGNITLWGQDVDVDWALLEPENRTTTLYVQNIHRSTTAQDLRNIFNDVSNYGVTSSKKIDHYAFVTFRTHEQAYVARSALDRTEIDGSKIKVYWGKPLADRTDGANNLMGLHNAWQNRDDFVDETQGPRTLRSSPVSGVFRGINRDRSSEIGMSGIPFGQQMPSGGPDRENLPHRAPPPPAPTSTMFQGTGQAAYSPPALFGGPFIWSDERWTHPVSASPVALTSSQGYLRSQ